jgi:S-adenosylmethionine decarboxylase
MDGLHATRRLLTIQVLISWQVLPHPANPMSVGTEWIVDAGGCDAARLRDPDVLRRLLDAVVVDLGLVVVGEPAWRVFPGEGGVTGLILLSESHLACHTYPEFGVATFNLYCCRERPPWPWAAQLRAALAASTVTVRTVQRGDDATVEMAEATGR